MNNNQSILSDNTWTRRKFCIDLGQWGLGSLVLGTLLGCEKQIPPQIARFRIGKNALGADVYIIEQESPRLDVGSENPQHALYKYFVESKMDKLMSEYESRLYESDYIANIKDFNVLCNIKKDPIALRAGKYFLFRLRLKVRESYITQVNPKLRTNPYFWPIGDKNIQVDMSELMRISFEERSLMYFFNTTGNESEFELPIDTLKRLNDIKETVVETPEGNKLTAVPSIYIQKNIGGKGYYICGELVLDASVQDVIQGLVTQEMIDFIDRIPKGFDEDTVTVTYYKLCDKYSKSRVVQSIMQAFVDDYCMPLLDKGEDDIIGTRSTIDSLPFIKIDLLDVYRRLKDPDGWRYWVDTIVQSMLLPEGQGDLVTLEPESKTVLLEKDNTKTTPPVQDKSTPNHDKETQKPDSKTKVEDSKSKDDDRKKPVEPQKTKKKKKKGSTKKKPSGEKLEVPNKITSPRVYIETFKDIAIDQMNSHGIPASITLAQGILESSYGTSVLCKKTNNHFGIKCHRKSCRDNGHCFNMEDDDPDDRFIKYKNASGSFEDHSKFLLRNKRYRGCFALTKRYKNAEITKNERSEKWCYALQDAGYATGANYGKKLCKLIARYKLGKYDA